MKSVLMRASSSRLLPHIGTCLAAWIAHLFYVVALESPQIMLGGVDVSWFSYVGAWLITALAVFAVSLYGKFAAGSALLGAVVFLFLGFQGEALICIGLCLMGIMVYITSPYSRED